VIHEEEENVKKDSKKGAVKRATFITSREGGEISYGSEISRHFPIFAPAKLGRRKVRCWEVKMVGLLEV
jgi:hypothetical protein